MKPSLSAIQKLCQDHWDGPLHFVPLPASGSEREYYRVSGPAGKCVAAYHSVIEENRAFFSFTRQFLALGLPVPEILSIREDEKSYLLTDLGDLTLFAHLMKHRPGNGWTRSFTLLYQRALHYLIRFQKAGESGFDFSQAYPQASFNRRSILWDLNYFKYCFLKPAGITFDEDTLEKDFESFAAWLALAGNTGFMYRDFQSRNIMLLEDSMYFIDYQGGRKGPYQYDLASLLLDAKADIPFEIREELLESYLSLTQGLPSGREVFMKYWPAFLFIRLFQAMGAYGFRGFVQQKALFLQSIPFALNNLKHLIRQYGFPEGMPELERVTHSILGSPVLNECGMTPEYFTLRIQSFSYRKGIPRDNTGNGGGFVFDCRGLPNPGREERFRSLTGNHPLVIEFLTDEPEVESFLNDAISMVSRSVDEYLRRGFHSLTVFFGCTGGQHRSVYTANQLAKVFTGRKDVAVRLAHGELSSPDQVSLEE